MKRLLIILTDEEHEHLRLKKESFGLNWHDFVLRLLELKEQLVGVLEMNEEKYLKEKEYCEKLLKKAMYNRLYRQKRLLKGLCAQCGKSLDRIGYYCSACLVKKKWWRKLRDGTAVFEKEIALINMVGGNLDKLGELLEKHPELNDVDRFVENKIKEEIKRK